MAANTSPIFPLTPYVAIADLSAVSACTTRGPTATAGLAAANIFLLCPASTNGRRVDEIVVKASSTSITAPTAAQIVGLWEWDGTKAYLIDEFAVSVVTPSVTDKAFRLATQYTNLVLPAAHALYVSTTVTTTAATTALTVSLFGGDY